MIGSSTQWQICVSAVRGRSNVLSRALIFTALVLLVLSGAALAQTVTRLKNQPPNGVQLAFQLTDGTVLAQSYNDPEWWKLTPDINGSYLNGTWSQVASLPSGY